MVVCLSIFADKDSWSVCQSANFKHELSTHVPTRLLNKDSDRFVLKQAQVLLLWTVCLFSFWRWTQDRTNGLNMSLHIWVCPHPSVSAESALCIPPTHSPSCSQHGARLWNSTLPVTLLGNPLGPCRGWGTDWSVIHFCWMRSFRFETIPYLQHCCSGKDSVNAGKTHIYITMNTRRAR